MGYEAEEEEEQEEEVVVGISGRDEPGDRFGRNWKMLDAKGFLFKEKNEREKTRGKKKGRKKKEQQVSAQFEPSKGERALKFFKLKHNDG